MSEEEVIIDAKGVRVNFGDFWALKGIDIEVKKGEIIVILGPSGSGKSTFIRTLNRLQPHSGGTIVIDGITIDEETSIADMKYVRSEIGMVFQLFNLFPHLTVLENITLAPMKAKGMTREEAEKIAHKLLERVGIPEQHHKFPSALSGGQQQRVAIARALVNNPSILLADEPTGNLDSRTSIEVMDIFQELNRTKNITVLLITHESDIAEYGSRIIRFHDGTVASDKANLGQRIARDEITDTTRMSDDNSTDRSLDQVR